MTQQTQTRRPYRSRHQKRQQERHPAHSYTAQEADAAPPDEFGVVLDSVAPAFHGDPAAVIPPGTPLAVQGKRYFKLAHHQRTIPAHFWGRFGVGMESESGFKILRDPRTGEPVVREHGDLKPGEVSLVLE